jgi:hypothetical protein
MVDGSALEPSQIRSHWDDDETPAALVEGVSVDATRGQRRTADQGAAQSSELGDVRRAEVPGQPAAEQAAAACRRQGEGSGVDQGLEGIGRQVALSEHLSARVGKRRPNANSSRNPGANRMEYR